MSKLSVMGKNDFCVISVIRYFDMCLIFSLIYDKLIKLFDNFFFEFFSIYLLFIYN